MATGKLIVLTAPLTESIDHAGFFIQMAVASLPQRLERVIDQKYPTWRRVDRKSDGSALTAPAGLRLLEASLLREYSADDVVCCYPEDLHKFVGECTRVVAVSTHNPLGVTFAAGVYASLFGSTKEPINSHHAKELFQTLKSSPHRANTGRASGGHALPTQKRTRPPVPVRPRIAVKTSSSIDLTQPLETGSSGLPPWR